MKLGILIALPDIPEMLTVENTFPTLTVLSTLLTPIFIFVPSKLVMVVLVDPKFK
jgi:hypothetical protein